MARALVLGATGHIGSHIVRSLLAENHTVRVVYRNPKYLFLLDGLSVERVPLDLSDSSSLKQACLGCDWVFHAASYYPSYLESTQRALTQGLEQIRRVLEVFCEVNPSRIVFTSSAATIRRTPDRLASEEDAEPWPLVGQRSLYATVKIALEHEILHAATQGRLPITIVNPSICLGEYDAHRFSGRAILIFAKGRLPFYIDSTLSLVYTGDVGIAHVRAAERGRIGERYLLTAHNMSLKEFAHLVAEQVGVPAPRWRLSRKVAMSVALGSECLAWLTRSSALLTREAIESARMVPGFDNAKAVKELGLPQTPITDTVRRAIAWFKAYGYL